MKSEGTQTIPYPFGYKGGYRMPGGNKGEGNVANGLYHYGQRYYDPTTGRWTQRDPLAQMLSATEANRYQGFGGDPVNLDDRTGEPGVPLEALCYNDNRSFANSHVSYCDEADKDELEDGLVDLITGGAEGGGQVIEIVWEAYRSKPPEEEGQE